MNTVFLGSGEFSRDLLRHLLRVGYGLDVVITRPDRPAGRGLRYRATPVKSLATDNDLTVYQPPGPQDPAFMDILDGLQPELVLVADYGYILPPAVLTFPPKGCVNVHPSLLPRYRGATPIQRALMDGVATSGVTLMLLDEGMDTGPVIAQKELAVEDDDDAGTLREKLASLGAEMFMECLPPYISGKLPPRPQDEERATYADPINKSELLIDWNCSARDIHNQVRALSPSPGAYSFLLRKRVKVLRARPAESIKVPGSGSLEIPEKDVLLVGTGEGVLQLEEVQPEGKRPMSAGEFLRGYRLQPGEGFSGPSA